jgi:hypothetical protein
VSVCAKSVSACTITTLHRARPWPPRGCRMCLTAVVPHCVRIPRGRTCCMHVADAAQGPTEAPEWCLCTCIAICINDSVQHEAATEPL